MVRMRKGGQTSAAALRTLSSRGSGEAASPLKALMNHPPSCLMCISLLFFSFWVGLNVHSMNSMTATTTTGGRGSFRGLHNFNRRRGSAADEEHSSTIAGRRPQQHREEAMLNILHANIFLVEISIPLGALSENNGHESYHSVTGRFCRIEWDAYKQDPAKTPMFKDLLRASPDCKSTKHLANMNIQNVVEQVRKYDDSSDHVHSLEIAGAVAHESRCGSTLTANMLQAASPAEHRVYSESPPPSTVFKRCENDPNCDWDKAAVLLQDVLYLMGRSNSKSESRVFYKLQMSGSRSLWLWRKAMVEQQERLKWVYIYRDSVEVLMSHFTGSDNFDTVKRGKTACLRVMMRPPQLLRDTAKQYDDREIKDMSNIDACAVHMTTLNEAAVMEHEEHGEGHFVEYTSLPDAVWDYILPEVFEVPVEKDAIERMKQVSGLYSKIKGGKTVKKEWEEDSAKKVQQAPEHVQKAARKFMDKSYATLQKLAWRKKSRI